MASTLRKLADKLEGKDKEHDNPHSSNFGPHSSNAANKLDPTIDSDRDGRNDPASRVGGYGNTQTTHSYTNTGGYGTAGGVGQPHSTTTGPHSSNLANKLDPRVDSDATHTSGGYGAHHTTAPHSMTQSSGINPETGNHPHSSNTGPHSSSLANKLDPRVDSDRDGRNDPTSRVGGYGNTQAAGTGYGTTHTGPGGYAGTNPALDNPHSTNVGPHSSNVLNKLDPRVDSDVDGRNDPSSRVGGYGQTHSTIATGNAPYGSNTGTHHTTTGPQGYTGTNVAHDDPRSTNTGPHSSNLLNKLDPRVDSDRDGRNDPTSKTGGYGQTQTGNAGVGRY